MAKRKLGEILAKRGQISPERLSKAIEEQNSTLVHLGEILFKSEAVEKKPLALAISEVISIPYVDCAAARPDPEALALISPKVAEQFNVLPLRFEDRCLVVVMSEPQDLSKLNQVAFSAGRQLSPRFGFKSEIAAAIRKHYCLGPSGAPRANLGAAPAQDGIEFLSNSKRASNAEAMRELQAELLHQNTPAVKEVGWAVTEAINMGASDIHIEPLAEETVVRFRLDGVLQEVKRIPRDSHLGLISRVKILCDMDIAERRVPQDGRFTVRLKARHIDMRVSTLPTQFGEKVVMRLLDGKAGTRTFTELGLPAALCEQFAELLALPQGMVLVTGPTGSGKSSTLCASIMAVQKPSLNIVTVEDPVEFEIPGVNQVNIHNKAGMTFAGALRSILRQDPNIIMIGEIRDIETAEIAMKATQTGHLVLSTLHTNGAAESVIRLLDLGVQGYLIAASLTGVMAQRLVRTLCKCAETRRVNSELARRLVQSGILDPPKMLRMPVGCELCNQTGYRGRIGLYELLVMQESLRDAVRSTAQVNQLRSLARACGMKTLREDGLEKVLAGITTLDEILRVVPKEMEASPNCEGCGQALIANFKYCPYCGAAREALPSSISASRAYAGQILQ